jgi:hydroxyacylglutathione hydrolase
MIIDRLFTPGLAQVAYMFADEASGEVAVIDPRRDTAAYLAWAAERGFQIAAILESHVHADFVSGARELAEATGAPIFTSRLGEQTFPHEPLDDGDEVAVGGLTLRALWTPGHTPEHLSYLAIDPAAGPDPVALFSGDVLFVGEVGRPDLLGKEQTMHLASQLYHTVSDRLAALEDHVVVYPGHTAGSACGKKIGEAPHTTIGDERRFNYAFKAQSKEGFVDMVLAGMPPPPTYYPILKRINKAGPPLLATLAGGEPLTPDQVATLQAGGAMIVDARSPEAFGGGHIPGSVFAGLGASFTAWMGWLAPYDRDLVLILEDDAQVEEARSELRRIGLDNVAGYLAGGIAAWQSAGREVDTLAQMTVSELARRLEDPVGDLIVLDVRRDDEWDMGHIAGACHVFAGEIVQGAKVPLDVTANVAVICGSGYRSSVTASLLETQGYRNLVNVIGGMDAWYDAGLPVTRPD